MLARTNELASWCLSRRSSTPSRDDARPNASIYAQTCAAIYDKKRPSQRSPGVPAAMAMPYGKRRGEHPADREDLGEL